MLNHKIRSYTVPPKHASTAWIAHNAAMEHKRPLLRQSRRTTIDSLYDASRMAIPMRGASAFWRRAELFGSAGAFFALLVLLSNFNG